MGTDENRAVEAEHSQDGLLESGPTRSTALLRVARGDWPVWLVALLVFANGSIEVLAGLRPNYADTGRLAFALPFGISTWHRGTTIVLGCALIFLSFHLFRRRRPAWVLGAIGLVAVVAFHAIFSHHVYLVSGSLLALVLLLVTRHRFTVRFEPRGLLQGLGGTLLILFVSLIWGTVAFYLLDDRDFGREIGFGEAMVRTLRQLAFIGNGDLAPLTRSARGFTDVLVVLGATADALALFSLFRPIVFRVGMLPRERRRAEALVASYGTSVYDHFKTWPDKSLYFPNPGAFVGYRVQHRVAVALGDPVAAPDQLEPAIRAFLRFARDNGWGAAFLMPDHVDVYRRLDLGLIKIGEEASVDLKHFLESTGQNKYFRRVRRTIEQQGVAFARYLPPHPEALVDELERVSKEWIGQTRYREFGFVQGTFSRGYLEESTLDVLRDAGGAAIAYVNEVPSARPGEGSFDMMRRLPGSHWATMDYLFYKMIESLAADGFSTLNLGLAPFEGVGEDPGATLIERTMHRVTAYTQRLARTQGLSDYKKKFEPAWESRYVVYDGGPLALPQVALAVTTIA
jgi:phosphatidylglycerol lysyltransferase